MADAETGAPPAKSSLGPRVVVGLLLLAVALGNIWMGGLAFTAMVGLGVVLIYREWAAMHAIALPWQVAGGVLLLAVSVLAHAGESRMALALLALALLPILGLAALLRHPRKGALVAGLPYAGLPAIALIGLRREPDGLELVLWTMGVVWATDILAYFSGRAIGGPKIWAAISPNKTWAGLAGGMAGAALFSAGLAAWRGWPHGVPAMLAAGALLAVAAQAGDFFESWLKRRAGVKDSGHLLPGHGGIMDRVDGLVPVACLVAFWVAGREPVQWVMLARDMLA